MNSNHNEAAYEVITGGMLRIEVDDEGRHTSTLLYPVTHREVKCECGEPLEVDLTQYRNIEFT